MTPGVITNPTINGEICDNLGTYCQQAEWTTSSIIYQFKSGACPADGYLEFGIKSGAVGEDIPIFNGNHYTHMILVRNC